MTPSTENPEVPKVFSFKPQNIALYASPTARNFYLANFYLPGIQLRQVIPKQPVNRNKTIFFSPAKSFSHFLPVLVKQFHMVVVKND